MSVRLTILRTGVVFGFAIAVVVALPVHGFAQDDPAKKERPRRVLPADSEPQEILKIDTDLVPLDVTVTDAKGRLVRNDREKLERAYERLAHEPNGMSTHTYDAVDDAVRMLVRHAPLVRQHRLMKRAVVVITDGFPVGDTVSADTVIERANAADTSVYVVTMPSYTNTLRSARMTPLPTPLDVSGLVEKTGGRSIYANEKDLGPLFRAIAEEVAAAYVLGFYPPEEKRNDGNFHTIRIEGPGGMTLRQSRPGYQAGGSKP